MSHCWSIEQEAPGIPIVKFTGHVGPPIMIRRETQNYIAEEVDLFADKLKTATVNAIELQGVVNSTGGCGTLALGIYEKLRALPLRKIFTIEGGAASAGSIIVMAGDHISIASDAHILIHEAHQAAFGKASMLHEVANDLERINLMIANTYFRRTGIAVSDLLELMGTGWEMTAKEALEFKFVDAIIPARNVEINGFETGRVSPGKRFIRDCLTCLSPCQRCMAE